MNSKIEHAYFGKEVSEVLQIGNSTLRKWCLALEKQGYQFTRGGHNNSRAFLERDILTLRRMKELIQNKNITLETASEIVMSRLQEAERTEVVPQENEIQEQTTLPALFVEQNEMIIELLERQEQLEKQNEIMFQKLQEQQNFIADQLEQKDRKFMAALQESRELQQQIASSLEEKKKGFFARLFGKD